MGREIATRGSIPETKAIGRAKQWLRESSIPPEYWPTFVDKGWADLEELTAAAELARQPALAAARSAAAA